MNESSSARILGSVMAAVGAFVTFFSAWAFVDFIRFKSKVQQGDAFTDLAMLLFSSALLAAGMATYNYGNARSQNDHTTDEQTSPKSESDKYKEISAGFYMMGAFSLLAYFGIYRYAAIPSMLKDFGIPQYTLLCIAGAGIVLGSLVPIYVPFLKRNCTRLIFGGWPAVLILFGGAVGGCLGATAAIANWRILKCERLSFLRFFASLWISLGAVIGYFIVVKIFFGQVPP